MTNTEKAPTLTPLQIAYNDGIEAAKKVVRDEIQDDYWRPATINAIARKTNPYGYKPVIATEAKCVKCPHVGQLDEQGRCCAPVFPTLNKNHTYPCGCLCEFPTTTAIAAREAAVEIAEQYYEFANSGLLAFNHGDEAPIIDGIAEIILKHHSPVSGDVAHVDFEFRGTPCCKVCGLVRPADGWKKPCSGVTPEITTRVSGDVISRADIVRSWAKELADPIPYDVDGTGPIPKPVTIPDADIETLISRLSAVQPVAAGGEVMRARIEALESLLVCYRVGKHPTEALLKKLDKTRVALEAIEVKGEKV